VLLTGKPLNNKIRNSSIRISYKIHIQRIEGIVGCRACADNHLLRLSATSCTCVMNIRWPQPFIILTEEFGRCSLKWSIPRGRHTLKWQENKLYLAFVHSYENSTCIKRKAITWRYYFSRHNTGTEGKRKGSKKIVFKGPGKSVPLVSIRQISW